MPPPTSKALFWRKRRQVRLPAGAATVGVGAFAAIGEVGTVMVYDTRMRGSNHALAISAAKVSSTYNTDSSNTINCMTG